MSRVMDDVVLELIDELNDVAGKMPADLKVDIGGKPVTVWTLLGKAANFLKAYQSQYLLLESDLKRVEGG